jgi:hypothetical protein
LLGRYIVTYGEFDPAGGSSIPICELKSDFTYLSHQLFRINMTCVRGGVWLLCKFKPLATSFGTEIVFSLLNL